MRPTRRERGRFRGRLRRLTDRATYLYVDANRYWYSTQPTVTRLADDRAAQLRDEDVLEEIRRRLRQQARTRGDFARVHACASGGDVPDEREARLVILGPEYPHTARDANSPARQEAARILDSHGTAPRRYKNTLVFLAADQSRLRELEQATRQYLAWKSIWEQRETLNLDAFQSRQAETKCNTADETVDARIPETFQWLLVPNQPDPKGAVAWQEIRQQGMEALAVRASKRLKNEEMLLTQLGGLRLRHELDRIPLWRGNHVGVRQLAEDFATYLYLPRLANDSVLLEAIRDGLSRLTWRSETFAYADQWNEERKTYVGLQAGQQVRVLMDDRSVLVQADVAAVQMQADRTTAGVGPLPAGQGTGTAVGPTGVTTGPEVGGERPTPLKQPPRRFHGSAALDATRVGRDASRIAEEVIQHLAGLVGAKVEVTLEIQAEVPEGVPEPVVRTVTENCRTLKFKSHGFENE